MKNWRHEAEILFFADGKTITDIGKELGVSVRSVSAYLNGLPHYAAEAERRKEKTGTARHTTGNTSGNNAKPRS